MTKENVDLLQVDVLEDTCEHPALGRRKRRLSGERTCASGTSFPNGPTSWQGEEKGQ